MDTPPVEAKDTCPRILRNRGLVLHAEILERGADTEPAPVVLVVPTLDQVLQIAGRAGNLHGLRVRGTGLLGSTLLSTVAVLEGFYSEIYHQSLTLFPRSCCIKLTTLMILKTITR